MHMHTVCSIPFQIQKKSQIESLASFDIIFVSNEKSELYNRNVLTRVHINLINLESTT